MRAVSPELFSVSLITLVTTRSLLLEYPDISGYGLTMFTLNLIPYKGMLGEARSYVIKLMLHIVSLLIVPVTLAVGSTYTVTVVSPPW